MTNEELLKLLRETVMRNHMALPENRQDEIWFDEGYSVEETPEFLKLVYETLGRQGLTPRKSGYNTGKNMK